MCVGCRLHYRYRYRLSKCSYFEWVTINNGIVIVYRLFLLLSYRNFSSFHIQPYLLYSRYLIPSQYTLCSVRPFACVPCCSTEGPWSPDQLVNVRHFNSYSNVPRLAARALYRSTLFMAQILIATYRVPGTRY